MSTLATSVPERSSLRLTTLFIDPQGEHASLPDVSAVSIVAYRTSDRATKTLDVAPLPADVIVYPAETSSTGRPYNFRYVTPATALPEPGDYEIVVRVTFGDNAIVAAEVFAVSVFAAE